MIARLARPALLLAATAALGACTAYDGFGYGGVSVGVSSGGYYPHRYSPYSYYGWYDGFYYPGAGYYIYDSYGRRHRWSDSHRHYWEGRRDGRRDYGENWDGYRRDRDGRYHDGNRDGNRGDYSRGREGDRDGRGDRGNWQRRDGDNNRGDRGNWQRRGNRDGETAGARRTPPPAARPSRERTEAPRTTRPEARGGRPSVDRGREFRRGSQD
jgi:hypothetical protein